MCLGWSKMELPQHACNATGAVEVLNLEPRRMDSSLVLRTSLCLLVWTGILALCVSKYLQQHCGRVLAILHLLSWPAQLATLVFNWLVWPPKCTHGTQPGTCIPEERAPATPLSLDQRVSSGAGLHASQPSAVKAGAAVGAQTAVDAAAAAQPSPLVTCSNGPVTIQAAPQSQQATPQPLPPTTGVRLLTSGAIAAGQAVNSGVGLLTSGAVAAGQTGAGGGAQAAQHPLQVPVQPVLRGCLAYKAQLLQAEMDRGWIFNAQYHKFLYNDLLCMYGIHPNDRAILLASFATAQQMLWLLKQQASTGQLHHYVTAAASEHEAHQHQLLVCDCAAAQQATRAAQARAMDLPGMGSLTHDNSSAVSSGTSAHAPTPGPLPPVPSSDPAPSATGPTATGALPAALAASVPVPGTPSPAPMNEAAPSTKVPPVSQQPSLRPVQLQLTRPVQSWLATLAGALRIDICRRCCDLQYYKRWYADIWVSYGQDLAKGAYSVSEKRAAVLASVAGVATPQELLWLLSQQVSTGHIRTGVAAVSIHETQPHAAGFDTTSIARVNLQLPSSATASQLEPCAALPTVQVGPNRVNQPSVHAPRLENSQAQFMVQPLYHVPSPKALAPVGASSSVAVAGSKPSIPAPTCTPTTKVALSVTLTTSLSLSPGSHTRLPAPAAQQQQELLTLDCAAAQQATRAAQVTAVDLPVMGSLTHDNSSAVSVTAISSGTLAPAPVPEPLLPAPLSGPTPIATGPAATGALPVLAAPVPVPNTPPPAMVGEAVPSSNVPMPPASLRPVQVQLTMSEMLRSLRHAISTGMSCDKSFYLRWYGDALDRAGYSVSERATVLASVAGVATPQELLSLLSQQASTVHTHAVVAAAFTHEAQPHRVDTPVSLSVHVPSTSSSVHMQTSTRLTVPGLHTDDGDSETGEDHGTKSHIAGPFLEHVTFTAKLFSQLSLDEMPECYKLPRLQEHLPAPTAAEQEQIKGLSQQAVDMMKRDMAAANKKVPELQAQEHLPAPTAAEQEQIKGASQQAVDKMKRDMAAANKKVSELQAQVDALTEEKAALLEEKAVLRKEVERWRKKKAQDVKAPGTQVKDQTTVACKELTELTPPKAQLPGSQIDQHVSCKRLDAEQPRKAAGKPHHTANTAMQPTPAGSQAADVSMRLPSNVTSASAMDNQTLLVVTDAGDAPNQAGHLPRQPTAQQRRLRGSAQRKERIGTTRPQLNTTVPSTAASAGEPIVPAINTTSGASAAQHGSGVVELVSSSANLPVAQGSSQVREAPTAGAVVEAVLDNQMQGNTQQQPPAGTSTAPSSCKLRIKVPPSVVQQHIDRQNAAIAVPSAVIASMPLAITAPVPPEIMTPSPPAIIAPPPPVIQQASGPAPSVANIRATATETACDLHQESLSEQDIMLGQPFPEPKPDWSSESEEEEADWSSEPEEEEMDDVQRLIAQVDEWGSEEPSPGWAPKRSQRRSYRPAARKVPDSPGSDVTSEDRSDSTLQLGASSGTSEHSSGSTLLHAASKRSIDDNDSSKGDDSFRPTPANTDRRRVSVRRSKQLATRQAQRDQSAASNAASAVQPLLRAISTTRQADADSSDQQRHGGLDETKCDRPPKTKIIFSRSSANQQSASDNRPNSPMAAGNSITPMLSVQHETGGGVATPSSNEMGGGVVTCHNNTPPAQGNNPDSHTQRKGLRARRQNASKLKVSVNDHGSDAQWPGGLCEPIIPPPPPAPGGIKPDALAAADTQDMMEQSKPASHVSHACNGRYPFMAPADSGVDVAISNTFVPSASACFTAGIREGSIGIKCSVMQPAPGRNASASKRRGTTRHGKQQLTSRPQLNITLPSTAASAVQPLVPAISTTSGASAAQHGSGVGELVSSSANLPVAQGSSQVREAPTAGGVVEAVLDIQTQGNTQQQPPAGTAMAPSPSPELEQEQSSKSAEEESDSWFWEWLDAEMDEGVSL